MIFMENGTSHSALIGIENTENLRDMLLSF